MTDLPGTKGVRPLAGATDRRIVVVFLVATFVLSWLMFLPVILRLADPESPAGLISLPLVGIGAPSIMAFVLTGLSQGREGVGELWRGGRRWRVGISWYAIVVLLPCLASNVAWVADAGLTIPAFGPWAPALVSGLLAGILEEFGWSGFAFPRFRRSTGSYLPALRWGSSLRSGISRCSSLPVSHSTLARVSTDPAWPAPRQRR